jgi:low temperature requirement protein LtrA
MVHWDMPQLHPHTNWFDLFFDLIFVATAYQLGSLLSASVNGPGLFFFISLFFSMLFNWQNKLNYDSRIDSDDLFHKLVDFIEALLVAIAALHIAGSNSETPVLDFLVLSKGHAWGFSLASSALRLLNLMRYTELYFWGLISPKARISIFVTSIMHLGSFTLYSVALIFSNSIWVGNTSGLVACAIWLMASIWENFFFLAVSMFKTQSRDSRIPMHLPYCLHRWGEWIMLIVGESVLSIIVGAAMDGVPTFYAVFVFGFLTATTLQFLYYSTQPFEPSMHAMRLSVSTGIMWRNYMGLFSLILVGFGVSLKMLLKYHAEAELRREYAWLFAGSLGGAYIVLQLLSRQHKAPEFVAGSSDARARWLVGVLKAGLAAALLLIPLVARSALALSITGGVLALLTAVLESFARSDPGVGAPDAHHHATDGLGAHGMHEKYDGHIAPDKQGDERIAPHATNIIQAETSRRRSSHRGPSSSGAPAQLFSKDTHIVDTRGVDEGPLRNRAASVFGSFNSMQQHESRL